MAELAPCTIERMYADDRHIGCQVYYAPEIVTTTTRELRFRIGAER